MKLKTFFLVSQVLSFRCKKQTSKNVADTTFKVSDRLCLKILTPKQMLQRLPIALAQVKAGNTFENLLNKIHHIIYSLYRPKEFIKKLYNYKKNSINL